MVLVQSNETPSRASTASATWVGAWESVPSPASAAAVHSSTAASARGELRSPRMARRRSSITGPAGVPAGARKAATQASARRCALSMSVGNHSQSLR